MDMPQIAPVETTTAPTQGKTFSWVLAGLWFVMAGMVHLLLLRTRLVGERNVYGVAAGVLGAVALVAYFRDTFLGPRGSTWALLLAITGGLIACVVLYDI